MLYMLFKIYIIKKICETFYQYVIGPKINKVDVKSYGQWALITGGTDGIGKEYAKQLAKRGCDIILVSRSMDKLKSVAKEIEEEFKVRTKVVQIDFSGDTSIYDKLAKEIKGLEIGTLVNNVGVLNSQPELFLDSPKWSSFITNMVNVNMVSMLRVTGLVLPDMVKRRKGIIINIGSWASELPCKYYTLYGATKAFSRKFSEGLRYEYGQKGILVQNVAPGVVSTKMTNSPRTNFAIPTPRDFVKSALGYLGTADDTNGFLAHSKKNVKCYLDFGGVPRDFFIVKELMQE